MFKIYLKNVEGHAPTAPKLGTPDSAAIDLACVVPEVVVPPGETVLVDTGIIARVPRDRAILILSRSSMAAKRSLVVVNSPGLIDRDYCGPDDTIKIALRNIGSEPQTINAGDRVAQMMLVPTISQNFTVYKTHEEMFPEEGYVKNRGGFGSTGT